MGEEKLLTVRDVSFILGISEKEVVSMAKSLPSIVQWISGKEVKKTIYVKGRLINFVV